ncbi:alkaline phosphatase D family protein [Vibrio sp. SCSIO 43140]|uniref:alkaline phosphatase D family protein n=1 Tax=Vibrio sp. SCSIO 43140 TaxID=2819100 RepID=UPI00207577BE|nr:alkaline phosphatase D family protein [Vibrio sp. SCSIO 43140]USD62498.1 alkaline phosphatase D family protein [Vibrio sp. SCSIO 43140]
MSIGVSRRNILKAAGAGLVVGGLYGQSSSSFASTLDTSDNILVDLNDSWQNTHDRIWIGGNYWANPMEDWMIKDGGVEVLSLGGNRSVHLLTHQITNPTAGFEMSVVVKRIDIQPQDGGAGLRLGARSELNDYRSNCFVQRGFDALYTKDTLILGNKSVKMSSSTTDERIQLYLKATAVAGAVTVTLTATELKSKKVLGTINAIASNDELLGNIAVVSNANIESTYGNIIAKEDQGCRYRFEKWQVKGAAFSVDDTHRFGPILWTMYTVNNSRSDRGHVMKMTAFVGPMGNKDEQNATLQLFVDNEWKTAAKAPLNQESWFATFEIENWDASKSTSYRVVYAEQHKDGTETLDVWPGEIQAEPKGRQLNMAAFTCQNDYAYPYEPLRKNVESLNPDLLFFSGDQLYESHGGFGVIRSPDDKAILNYLRKYYQFGWVFRESMSRAPTICIPDDHDILQGNMWGEGGAIMANPEKDPSASVLTGYIQSPRFVNVVHDTHTSHHPAPYNVAPAEAQNGIKAYFGEILYGNVSFAVLSDRQFKSGPDRVDALVGITGRDEEPLYFNPSLDNEKLEMLGATQEAFLTEWTQQWDQHALKAVLSQTVFASLATHNGGPDKYLKYDFDSNGWPASSRDRAVNIIKDSMALHICGDTHLASISQYGVEKQRDANWAFAVPAIAAGWQRFWIPESVGIATDNRPSHGLPHTGESLDAFGTKNYVYAVANPVVGQSDNRYVRAQEKGSGFGVIEFDTDNLTYRCTAYRFLADVNNPNLDNIYEGWPVTIEQKENRGENIIS